MSGLEGVAGFCLDKLWWKIKPVWPLGNVKRAIWFYKQQTTVVSTLQARLWLLCNSHFCGAYGWGCIIPEANVQMTSVKRNRWLSHRSWYCVLNNSYLPPQMWLHFIVEVTPWSVILTSVTPVWIQSNFRNFSGVTLHLNWCKADQILALCSDSGPVHIYYLAPHF